MKSILNRKNFFVVLVSVAVLGISAEVTTAADSTIVSGAISTNAVWQGEVLVEASVFVPRGITLKVLPGTHVRFKHYRGYREPEKRLSLEVSGRLIAEGTASEPIYFTSDAPDPQNGDWSKINLHHSKDSIFRYCVVEFGQQGLCVSGGSHEFSHCVIRWHNWEGFFFQSHSEPNITHCHIVENGYPGLAAEQFCSITMDYCEAERNGNSGVHIGTSTAEIRRSLVHDNLANGLAVTGNATLRALGVASNDNGWGRGGCGIWFGGGTNIVEVNNVTLSGNRSGGICGPYTVVEADYEIPETIDIGFTPDMSYELGYIPGDPDLDGYMYVYPDDETRRIVRKIGKRLGQTWSLAWDGQYIWTATLLGTVSKLNPLTGAVLQQFTAPGPQPWGMTYDGEHLWIVDYAEKRISKVDPATGAELATYPTPDPVAGCIGVTWDGTYLYVMGFPSSVIYKMDREGHLVDTIVLDTFAGHGIAWDGQHFWVPGPGKILKFDTQGHMVGWIYAASEDTWDLTWDGRYLWASQSTNQNWDDAKIFALKILDGPYEPRTIFVDSDAPGSNDGSSWHDAYNYLQDALAVASSGDEIWVAEGIYKPDSNSAYPNGTGVREATFQLKNGLAIYGGYAGCGEPDPNAWDVDLYETILSGDLAGNDVDVNYPSDLWGEPTRNENSYNVVTGSGTDGTAVLDGFTITGGNANAMSEPSLHLHCGGGMFNCEYSNPTLINCIFSGNSAWQGGGMYNGGFDYSNDTGPTLTNCMFTGNSAEHVGGGMANSGDYPTLINCIFLGNSGGGGGGGMYNYISNPTLTGCTFIGNSAPELLIGGGGGGGMGNNRSSPILTNCTFSGNSALFGGGMRNSYESNPTITNCILWDDTPNEIYIYSVGWPGGTPVVTYSDVQGDWPGEGNINDDPRFVQPGYWADVNDPNIPVEPNDPNAVWVDGDYHLLPDSPCIDEGNNIAVPPDVPDLDGDGNTAEPIPFDLEGNPRIVDGNDDGNSVVDMGAYEADYIEVPMKFTPKALNLRSKGKWVKAHFVLPEGFLPEDVDANTPAKIGQLGIESAYVNVFIDDGLVEIEAAFSRSAFCGAGIDYGPADVVVIGKLISGQDFYGTDMVRIIANNINHLAVLASYWLQAGCGAPDWCNGADLDRDSEVNFVDFAMLDGCCIEVVKE